MVRAEIVRALQEARSIVDEAMPLPLSAWTMEDTIRLRVIALEFCLYVIKEDLDDMTDLLGPSEEDRDEA